MKSPLKKAKDKAWVQFSRYIRRRDADEHGYASCVTCGKTEHWKSLQAGHFIDSRNNTVLFNDKLVWSQCPGCNLFKKGNKVAYTLFMMRQGHTAEDITEMLQMKHKTKKMSIADFKDIEDKYLDLNVGLDIKGVDG